jgi:glycine cleavage system H protein
MAESLTFMMGKFVAELPGDLLYAGQNHMWCRSDDGRLRFGFTAYAVRLMQDVYFLDWVISAGDNVTQLQQIGHIETSKAVADLFAPLTGTLVAFNQELLQDPSTINVDKYGNGWLFEMDGDSRALLNVNQYHQYLADNWEKTQRVIKGKINIED